MGIKLLLLDRITEDLHCLLDDEEPRSNFIFFADITIGMPFQS